MKYSVMFTRKQHYKVDVEAASEEAAILEARIRISADASKYQIGSGGAFEQDGIGHDITPEELSDVMDYANGGERPCCRAAKRAAEARAAEVDDIPW